MRLGLGHAIKKGLTGQRDRVHNWWQNLTLKDVASAHIRLWQVAVAIGVLFYFIRYQLELDSFFPNLLRDIRRAENLKIFLIAKWDSLILTFTFLLTYLVLNIDVTKWTNQAEKCFSTQNTPGKWVNVRWRAVVPWVVLSNVAIFISTAYFINNVVVFSLLFAAHHLNAVFWIKSFRLNVEYYFYNERWKPPSSDPYRPFILDRRQVMEAYLSKVRNIEREGLTAAAYAVSFVLAVHKNLHAIFYIAPYVFIPIAEGANQFFSHLERRARNDGLRKIEGEEQKAFARPEEE